MSKVTLVENKNHKFNFFGFLCLLFVFEFIGLLIMAILTSYFGDVLNSLPESINNNFFYTCMMAIFNAKLFGKFVELKRPNVLNKKRIKKLSLYFLSVIYIINIIKFYFYFPNHILNSIIPVVFTGLFFYGFHYLLADTIYYETNDYKQAIKQKADLKRHELNEEKTI